MLRVSTHAAYPCSGRAWRPRRAWPIVTKIVVTITTTACLTRPNPLWEDENSGGETHASAQPDTVTSGSTLESAAADDADDSDDNTGTADMTSDGEYVDWWNTAWNCRRELVIDSNFLPEPLEGFPLLLDTPHSTFAGAAADGADLRFVDASGRELSHEFERFDGAENTTVWIRVEQLEAERPAESIYVYYCNPGAQREDDAARVWDGYTGVFHLSELTDATGASPLTPYDVALERGWIGDGALLAGNENSYLVLDAPAPSGLFAAGGTICAGIYLDSFGEQGHGRIVDRTRGVDMSGGWTFNVENTVAASPNTATIRFGRGYDSSETLPFRLWEAESGSISLATWHFVCVTYDERAGDAAIYVDGLDRTAFVSAEVRASLSAETDLPLRIGRGPDGLRWYDGMIDEVRLEPVLRSPEWIDLQSRSVHRELVTLGDEEQRLNEGP